MLLLRYFCKMRAILFFLILVLCIACNSKQDTAITAGTYTSVNKENLEYYLYRPKNLKEKKPGLLLFLHGGGEAGAQLKHLKLGGPPKLMEEAYPFPFLVLAPQHPYADKWWNTQAVYNLLQDVVAKNNVDTNRIYLTGLSRGGYAAWELAINHKETFAAMAVVSAMAPVPYAHWLNHEMPIWLFHGAQDSIMPASEADNMVAKLKELKFNVRYTKYPKTGHNAWDKAYTTDSLYIWMAQQKRN